MVPDQHDPKHCVAMFEKLSEYIDGELDELNRVYVGRPNPLYYAERLTEHLGGAKVYFKREDLNHTGAHKINNTLGQVRINEFLAHTDLPQVDFIELFNTGSLVGPERLRFDWDTAARQYIERMYETH